MATYVGAVADVFAFEATSGTTSSFSQGSSGQYLFGGAAWVTFGTTPTISDLKYGGSGGTTITANGSDTSFLFGNGNTRAGEVIPGPSSTTTIYTAGSGVLQGAAAGVSYEGVDSSSDFTTNSGVAGDVSTAVASVTVPNCVTGQTVTAIVFAASTSLTLTAFTAVSGTTIRAQEIGTDLAFVGIAVLEKVAAADGDCTLSVNVNSSTSSGEALGWVVKGERLIDASGGGSSTISAAAGAATASAMAGSSTASTTASAAAGAATASAATGSATSTATWASASGAATTSAAAGSSTVTAAEGQASGAATAGTLAGSSTAVASFNAASGSATASTMSSDLGAASINGASGAATTSEMAGSSLVVASFNAASGSSSTANFAGPQEAVTTSGAPGPAHRFIAYINGKRVVGSYWEIQRLVEELAEEQAEKDVAKPKPAKKPRIVVQPGKPVAQSNSENIKSISDTQGREIQNEIRNTYHIAYIKAKLRAEQDEEDTMMVLL